LAQNNEGIRNAQSEFAATESQSAVGHV